MNSRILETVKAFRNRTSEAAKERLSKGHAATRLCARACFILRAMEARGAQQHGSPRIMNYDESRSNGEGKRTLRTEQLYRYTYAVREGKPEEDSRDGKKKKREKWFSLYKRL